MLYCSLQIAARWGEIVYIEVLVNHILLFLLSYLYHTILKDPEASQEPAKSQAQAMQCSLEEYCKLALSAATKNIDTVMVFQIALQRKHYDTNAEINIHNY